MRSLSSDQMADLLSVHGAVDEDEMRHLAGLALQVCDGCIVEVGAFRGRSTAALAMGSMMGSHAPVYAIDPQETFVGVYGGEFGSEDRGSFFESMVRLRLYPIVRLVNLSSEWLSTCWPLPVRLLWVDGDHRYAGVRRDIDCWLPKLHDDATIVFDDAVDQEVGPYHVIEQLTADGVWTRGETIGKTVTLFRGAGCAG